ncbi:MAG: hypothetical protein ACREJC_19600, partial [Tepidisphaeraceae bacterium]
MDDKQLNAMQKIVQAFDGLDETDLKVVLGFIAMRYGAAKLPAPQVPGRTATGVGAQDSTGAADPAEGYATFPDLYHAASPETESDKALVAGYWAQVCQQKDSFDSFSANSALKDMGYTVSNITRAFDFLMSQDPKYVMQVKKSGTSRQARKMFKLTQAGLK